MPSATFTVSSGSERVVEVYPQRRGHSSGGSASVHSPTSSGSRSFSSASSDSYIQVEAPFDEEDDGIEPSDSASRSRQPPSRRRTTEARPAPTRRHSSRRVEREELPRRRSPRRHHSSRHRREESRRTPSDGSSSVASYDDYPYSHHGAPQPPRAYPPPSGFRHVPAQSHGGYPPSMTSAAPYPDPFAHQQAMVHSPHQDAFGYPQPNPFSPHIQQQNPFSPISQGGSSYFSTDPHAPPPPMAHQHRPAGPPRPQSFAAPSQYGSEMAMSPYPPPGMPSYSPYQMPGMPGYPPMPWPYPAPSHTSSPAPKEEKPEKTEVKEDKKDDKTSAEIESLKALIQKHEEARLAAEAERLAKAQADAAAAAARKAAEEADKLKKEEIAKASKEAKEEAEKKAAEAAKKAKEEHEKKLAEVMKAQEEAEKKQKELEEEAAKNKPIPDMLKAPIKFKDAVGRKFSFPFHLCKSWKGMEGLIKQAFLHVDLIGDHVHQGHYDLTGPDGEIILPQVWDTMIQPDWEVTMHMWPMPEPPPKEETKKDKLAEDAAITAAIGDPFAGMSFRDIGIMDVGQKKPKKAKDGKGKRPKSEIVDIIDVPAGPGFGAPMPPPPGFPPGMGPLPGMEGVVGVFPPGMHIVEDKKQRPKAKSKGSKDISPWTAWMVGGRPAGKKR